MKKWITGRRRAVGAGAVGVVVAAVVAGSLWASDHQDTPTVEFTPRFDINDVYAFPAATAGRTVLVLGTSSPLSPAQTATHAFGNVSDQLYQLKIDNTGDAREDLVFQLTFTGPAGKQKVTLRGPVKPNSVGTLNTLVGGKPIKGYTNTVIESGGIKLFAGPRDDPFFIDLGAAFDTLNLRSPAVPTDPAIEVGGTVGAGFEALVGPYSSIVDGDAKVYSIACASVVAKVVRDRMMERLAIRYPGYGWEHNQGYATLEHRQAIRRLGLTPFHRRSFLALQRTLAGDQLELDLLGDPAASAATYELLARELVPVMADDAMLDSLDLESLELGAPV